MPTDFRTQLPALANKTYFNNPALPRPEAKIFCLALDLSDPAG
jgi:hypothetical protein